MKEWLLRDVERFACGDRLMHDLVVRYLLGGWLGWNINSLLAFAEERRRSHVNDAALRRAIEESA